MPSADERTAYALEHIAFRVGRIEQSLARIAAAIESLLARADRAAGQFAYESLAKAPSNGL
jgi:hypothetical protein